MEFVAATNNKNKLAEMCRILESMGHTVISQRAAGLDIDPEETGTTFAENALIKAQAVCTACGKAAIADDSGLCVDALGGAPGVYSARYCGRHGDDEANNDKLLAEMQPYPQEAQRTAKFVSAICVALPDGRHFTYLGECPGWVGFARKGTNGFGYDPIFNVPQFANRSYAELTAAEKDTISHRGAALRLLQHQLPQMLASENCLGSVRGTVTLEVNETPEQ